jgi:hypothetical protein
MIDFSGAGISPGNAAFFEKFPSFFIEIGAILPVTRIFRRYQRHSFGVKTGMRGSQKHVSPGPAKVESEMRARRMRIPPTPGGFFSILTLGLTRSIGLRGF